MPRAAAPEVVETLPDLAACFVVNGLVCFTVAMLQGFTIPGLNTPKLGLVCHVKTVLHALLLLGLGPAMDYVTLGARGLAVAKYLVVGGVWGSFVGDFWASLIGEHLPIAAKGAGPPAKCFDAEEDYTIPKSKRPAPKGAPHPAQLLIKLPAVAMAVGVAVLAYGADMSQLL